MACTNYDKTTFTLISCTSNQEHSCCLSGLTKLISPYNYMVFVKFVNIITTYNESTAGADASLEALKLYDMYMYLL